ncbi:putative pantothenate transporter [Xylariomycetidae sp. FL2044]|nr:putative pantothenate transporter [Xylariomycetidae sp. FL2044]
MSYDTEVVQVTAEDGRFRKVVWDSLDRSPQERRFISKIDFFILTWAGLSYFSKNLNQSNVSNAYVSGMKEELNVVGNQYQTFTTMWTMSVACCPVSSDLRLSLWCPSWELFWVVVTFATAAVKTPQQIYACRFLVGLGEGTFYPAVHTVLGGWYTKQELAKRACIFFASAFVGSMFSGYLQAGLYTGMNGAHGISGWRWLFIFDGIITLPMALWGYYALPDLPSNTRVKWLSDDEKKLALTRMEKAGKKLEEPVTISGLKRVLRQWHFWVYTAYYTFFICSENIGSYMNLWLKSLNRYTVPQINTYSTPINAITIVTTLIYGWVSDGFQVRAPIVYFSLGVCFFAAMNLAIWDGVPFGLKWASFYLTGFDQGSGPVFLTMVNEHCAGDSLERKLILGSTNSVAYAFNAWIPLITYNTTLAPRFLVGNSVTVALIVLAALTLTTAITLQRHRPPHSKEEAAAAFKCSFSQLNGDDVIVHSDGSQLTDEEGYAFEYNFSIWRAIET